MPHTSPDAAAQWLTELAVSYMKSPDNDLHMTTGHEPAFDLPLVGFAAGNDPLWKQYKEYVGSFHWTPLEAFALRYPNEQASASDLVVMNWILPQTKLTRDEHRKQKDLPSERWVRARVLGEKYVHDGLRKHVLAALEAKGIQAVAPVLLDQWSRMPSDKYVLASTWSERHAAYAAGQGTFGLCDGLITPRGKAMRTGSVVVRLPVSISEREYTTHREYCLFFSKGTCGICIKKCPVGALSEKGHDKNLCKNFIRNITKPYVAKTWGLDGYGCGLCQVGVPCETGIPGRQARK